MLKFLPLMALVLVGCALDPPQPALVKQTPSGFAEGTFRHASIADVQAKFAAKCVSLGWTVDGINPMQISCVHDQLGLRAETWRYTTTWTMVQIGSDVHASAAGLLGYPGGPKSPVLGDNAATNKMQTTMNQLGAE
jgi:hypothetical protein